MTNPPKQEQNAVPWNCCKEKLISHCPDGQKCGCVTTGCWGECSRFIKRPSYEAYFVLGDPRVAVTPAGTAPAPVALPEYPQTFHFNGIDNKAWVRIEAYDALRTAAEQKVQELERDRNEWIATGHEAEQELENAEQRVGELEKEISRLVGIIERERAALSEATGWPRSLSVLTHEELIGRVREAKQTAAQLRQERDDAVKDYQRIHNDKCNLIEEQAQLREQLRAITKALSELLDWMDEYDKVGPNELPKHLRKNGRTALASALEKKS